jgi:hypothetical protein
MNRIFFLTVLVGVWFVASSDIAPDRYGNYTPFFMERSELERSVSYSDEVRQMVNPGKIWINTNGDKIYVVEKYKGVHIIDNSNPEFPRQTKFITAPGCMDVAVKDNIIYLDNAVDLVAFDLTSGEVTERLKDFFPAPVSPNGQQYNSGVDGMILVGWKGVNE